APARAGAAPRFVAGGFGGRRRPARPRSPDPLLRRVPRPGSGPLAAAPARRGLLPRLLLALPPPRWAAGALVARAGGGPPPPGGRAHRPAGVDPRVARHPGRP